MSPIAQIQDSTARLKASVMHRIDKPDHPAWRSIANWLVIVGGPVGELLIQLLVPEEYKKAASIAWVTLIGTFKAGSKLTTK